MGDVLRNLIAGVGLGSSRKDGRVNPMLAFWTHCARYRKTAHADRLLVTGVTYRSRLSPK
jgi:hypothetical protein